MRSVTNSDQCTADVKANNILIDYKHTADGVMVKQVQLVDIEDAAIVPARFNIVGKQAGNLMWHSPEAHARDRSNKPSDMFSFGIAVSPSEPEPIQSSCLQITS